MSDEPRIPSSRDLPPERLQRRKEMLVSEIAAGTPAAPGRTRYVVAVAAALAVAAVATGFGAYALTRDEPTHVDSIGCYETADLRSNVAVIGNTARDPLAACAELWERGVLRPETTTAPALQACVLDTGAVAIMPSDTPDVCNDLGIARLSDQGRTELQRLGAVQAALVERLGVRCAGEAEARRIARDELDRGGLHDWSVVVSGAGLSVERPCASPTIERRQKRIVIVPVPR